MQLGTGRSRIKPLRMQAARFADAASLGTTSDHCGQSAVSSSVLDAQ